MLHKSDLPLYMRMSQLLIGLLAFFYILYLGQDILVPLIFSLIIAILLNPFVNLLERKLNRVVSISIAVAVASIISMGIIFFIGSQVTMFSDSWPLLKVRFHEILSDSISWIAGTFNISTTQIDSWLAKTKNEGLNNSTMVIGQTLSTLSGILVIVFLIPVYIFLFLFYKPLLLNFIAKLFPQGQHKTVVDVLNETKSLIQNYLIGLLIVFALVSILNTTALLADCLISFLISEEL